MKTNLRTNFELQTILRPLLVLAASLWCAGLANAATLNEWLFNASPTAAQQYAVNEVTGGAVVSEQNYGVAYKNLQVAGGPFYSTLGGQALFLATGESDICCGASNFIDWSGRTSFTIELWVNPTSGVGGTQDVLDDNGQLLRLAAVTGGFELQGYIYDAAGYHSTAFGSIVIPTNAWTHIALTYDGATIKTYVGSALDAQASYATTSLSNSGNGLYIGSYSGAVDVYKGYIAEIREGDAALPPGNGSGEGTLAWNASLPVPPPVPAASWLLDDGSGSTAAATHGGSALNGTFGSSTTWSTSVPTVSGYGLSHVPDKSLAFSGAGAVTVPDSAMIDPTGSISVSAWIKHTNSGSSTYGIVQKGLAGSGGYLLYLSSGKVGFKIQNAGGTTYTAQGSTNTADNAWHLATGAYDAPSQTLTIYLDGNLQTTTSNAAMVPSAQPLYIAGAGTYFIGSIDEPAVYNYALSATEARYLHTHSIRPIFPEDYGALGDGIHDDTAAFQQAASVIQANNGGTLALNPNRASNKIYLVGKQTSSQQQNGQPFYQIVNTYLNTYPPAGISRAGNTALCIYLYQIHGAFCLLGQNSTMRLNPGLHFGAFNPSSGAVYNDPSGFVDRTKPANAQYINWLGYCIWLEGCSNGQIRDLTVDGNVTKLVLGGYVEAPGDGEFYDIPAYGLLLNTIGNMNPGGQAQVTNCSFINNAVDGILIQYDNILPTTPVESCILTNVTANYNGRNGLSWVGGNSLTAANCKFDHNGLIPGSNPPASETPSPTAQAPEVGVDIENESGFLANSTFTNCEFIDNASDGLSFLNASYTSSGDVFTNCTFWGSRSYAFWNQTTPNVVCNNCTFYGPVEDDYNAPDAAHGTQFNTCTFSDSPPATYPPGTNPPVTYPVYNALQVVVTSSGSRYVTFNACTVNATQNTSFWVQASAAGGVTFTGCSIYHNWTGYNYPVNTIYPWISLIEEATLTNTHFYEAAGMPSPQFGIMDATVSVGPGVIVDGPHCLWYGYAGPYPATIPQGNY